VKKALLSLTLLSLVAVVTPSAIAVPVVGAGTITLPVFQHPGEGQAFALAEAYPAIPGLLSADHANKCLGEREISAAQPFCGVEQIVLADEGDPSFTGHAVPGIFALQSHSVSEEDPRQRLDVNCFAMCPPNSGQTQPFVQSFRLIKNVPGSNKCPVTYGPRTFLQFGSGIRTWWSLIYTQPGTTFTLELTVRCLQPNGKPALHVDKWVWEVVATFESTLRVLDVLHTNAIGTTEVPCISSEDMYIALRESVKEIRDIITQDPENIVDAQDSLFKTEALLIAFCAFTDCFIPENVFSVQFPPSNDMQSGDFGWTGIIDTLENPCCCKVMVDIESIGECYGITFN
jgi:hypothetical protein